MEWLQQFSVGERGVSPVIGVVLMVSIAVILAAVVGAFVMQFGDQSPNPAPNVGSTVTYDQSTDGDGQSLTIEVRSGESIPVSKLTVQVLGAKRVEPGGSTTAVEYTGNALASIGTDLSVTDKLTLDKTHFTTDGGGSIGSNEYLDLSDATVRLLWSDGPETSGIIFEWDGKKRS